MPLVKLDGTNTTRHAEAKIAGLRPSECGIQLGTQRKPGKFSRDKPQGADILAKRAECSYVRFLHIWMIEGGFLLRISFMEARA